MATRTTTVVASDDADDVDGDQGGGRERLPEAEPREQRHHQVPPGGWLWFIHKYIRLYTYTYV